MELIVTQLKKVFKLRLLLDFYSALVYKPPMLPVRQVVHAGVLLLFEFNLHSSCALFVLFEIYRLFVGFVC